MTITVARDAQPPLLLVRVMNPILRVVLRTPFGRLVPPFALLEFHGRRSGRLLRVPVGWHEIDTGNVVFPPAPWRVNFHGGTPVTVRHRGQRLELVGMLDDDVDTVAAALQSLADRRGSLRSVGVEIPDKHRVTATDVEAVDRALIRFEPAGK